MYSLTKQKYTVSYFGGCHVEYTGRLVDKSEMQLNVIMNKP